MGKSYKSVHHVTSRHSWSRLKSTSERHVTALCPWWLQCKHCRVQITFPTLFLTCFLLLYSWSTVLLTYNFWKFFKKINNPKMGSLRISITGINDMHKFKNLMFIVVEQHDLGILIFNNGLLMIWYKMSCSKRWFMDVKKTCLK